MGAITAEVVETGEVRDAHGRRRVARGQRLAALAAFRKSGISMAAFARREGLNYSTFAGWVIKEGKPAPAIAPIAFAQVQAAPLAKSCATGTLEVRLPDGTVLSGTNAAGLAALIKALRS